MTGALSNRSRVSASTAQARSGALTRARAHARESVRVVTLDEEFLGLARDWNTLVENCRVSSVFLRHEWFEAVWQWRKNDAALFILLWFREEALAGILPLTLRCADLRKGAVRCLEFLTVPDSQLCDLIVGAGDESAAAYAFVDALAARRHVWDVIRLRGLPRGAACAALTGEFRNHGFVIEALPPDRNPYIALDGTWDEYYKTRSRSLKKANNLAANRLQKAGEVTVDWHTPEACAPAPDLDRTVATVIDISARSWKGSIETGLDKPGPRAFIRRLSERASEQGWLSVWTVRLDGRPVAMEYQMIADGNVYALRGDFDAACETISPGSYLSRQLLERLFDRGLRRYFLGPGENEYKLRWTDQAEPLDEQWVYGRTLRGRWLALWVRRVKPVLRLLRNAIRQIRPVPPGATPGREGE